jgi:CRP-like cAMP-binding protein
VSNNALLYLTPDDWTLINAKAQRRIYKLGDEILREGSLAENIYILRRGEACVELAVSSARTLLATLGPDDICGDMAFLDMAAATAAVVAKDTEVEADEIKAKDLRELFDAFPRLASRFYRSLGVVLARRLRQASRELAHEMTISDRRRGAEQSPPPF